LLSRSKTDKELPMFSRASRKRALTFCAIFFALMVPAPVSAYEKDFHYYVVYLLLRCKGFDIITAHEFAGFSQYVDDNRFTEPIYNDTAIRRRFHFIHSGKRRATFSNDDDARKKVVDAFEQWRTGDPSAKYLVGCRLHTFADTFSHASFTANWSFRFNAREHWSVPIGHADTGEWGHAPDRPYNDAATAIWAAQAIYELLPNQSGRQIAWEFVKPELVGAFVGKTELAPRIAKVRAVISKLVGEETNYDKEEFTREREKFESAIFSE